MDDELRQQFQALGTLITGGKESLEREFRHGFGKLNERIDRMDARLGKIAAGAHYVTRLAEWSEPQDQFQLDILHRVQVLESRVDKLQNGSK